MVIAWLLVGVVVCSSVLSMAFVQRALFDYDRRLELSALEVSRLEGEVALRDRKLEAEEILLRKAGELMRVNLHDDK